MTRSGFLLAVVFAAGGVVGWLANATKNPAALAQQPAVEPAATAQPQPATKADSAEAGIKASTAEYAKAFNAGDAKAAAMLFTENGEYVGDDGEPIKGRTEIEKSLAAFFKANPMAKAEVRVESVKVMGRGLASCEGVVLLDLPGDDPIIESRYSSLHVLQDGKWLAASVGEWVPDPATNVTTKALDWLVGEWTATGEGREMKITYTWGEDKVFLTGKYVVTQDGETVSKGTQVFGNNPAGGLRSWLFDNSGTTSDGFWVRDGNRWLCESFGVLPDGTEVTALNVIVPLGPDEFTWQTAEREINGEPVEALPPVKVTRVKK